MIDVGKTAGFIARTQSADGAIPWFPGGQLDPWDHVEAAMGLDVAGLHAEATAAYRWLARAQNQDGSWYAEYRAGTPTDLNRDANFTAYVAVGAYHHFLATGDTTFLGELWSTVDAAITFALSLQHPSGAMHWRRRPDGTLADELLLTGCCSIHHALLCANAIAEILGHHRPGWTTAASRIRDAVTTASGIFLSKPLAMDWYYPVLGGLLGEDAAKERISRDWNRFVQPGYGVRCVDHEPWVTGGETAELALTVAVAGNITTARQLLDDVAHLDAGRGTYWTGYNHATDSLWPRECTTWTAGALLLADSAVKLQRPTLRTFDLKRRVQP